MGFSLSREKGARRRYCRQNAALKNQRILTRYMLRLLYTTFTRKRVVHFMILSSIFMVIQTLH